jgi:hypothetical protein
MIREIVPLKQIYQQLKQTLPFSAKYLHQSWSYIRFPQKIIDACWNILYTYRRFEGNLTTNKRTLRSRIPSTPVSSEWYIPFRFFDQNLHPFYISPIRATCLAHLILFNRIFSLDVLRNSVVLIPIIWLYDDISWCDHMGKAWVISELQIMSCILVHLPFVL